MPEQPSPARFYVGLLFDLGRHDRVFGAFCDPELDYLLGRDLDGFTRCRVTSHARLSIHTDQTAQSGDYKEAILLDFLDSGFREKRKYLARLGIGDFASLGHRLDDLSLGHCHALEYIPH